LFQHILRESWSRPHLNLINTELQQASGVLSKNHVENALEVLDDALGVGLVLVEHVEENAAAGTTILCVKATVSCSSA
jgi:hypothetical protein